MRNFNIFIKEAYSYNSRLGIRVKYVSKARMKREAGMLRSIYQRAPQHYERVIKYGLDNRVSISELSNKLPEIIDSFYKELRAKWEFKEGYKYPQEEKDKRYMEWLNELSTKEE